MQKQSASKEAKDSRILQKQHEVGECTDTLISRNANWETLGTHNYEHAQTGSSQNAQEIVVIPNGVHAEWEGEFGFDRENLCKVVSIGENKMERRKTDVETLDDEY
jgi:hypothetical protein